MKLLWQIEDSDVDVVKRFYNEHKNNDSVLWRRSRNVEGAHDGFTYASFWREIVICLLTTQARAGPNSAVSRFGGKKLFPLNYTGCKRQRNLKSFARKTLAEFGGIRRNVTISEQISDNFQWLEKQGGWKQVKSTFNELMENATPEMESEAAYFIDHHLRGFGPKQSRNLLQSLGWTKYEIPIDSRITKWLNEFGFPINLSANGLADLNYYKFVSQGFRELCDACNIYPCELDAAIFSSFDR